MIEEKLVRHVVVRLSRSQLVAQMAATVAAGLAPIHNEGVPEYDNDWGGNDGADIATDAVAIARAIILEVQRTEPPEVKP